MYTKLYYGTITNDTEIQNQMSIVMVWRYQLNVINLIFVILHYVDFEMCFTEHNRYLTESEVKRR